MYEYQKSNSYFAQTADDIKDISAEELASLGAENISPGYRGIQFTATQEVVYSINYNSRLINRVLAPLVSFHCPSDNVLYKKASQIEWNDFLTPEETFAVFATVNKSQINHSKFASLRLKDAIVDYFRNHTGKRPSIDTREPDIWFNLYIEKDKAIISADTSGGSLHRRGYRKESVAAPMIETLAASIIRLSQWEGTTEVYDPFCGSGTLLCEAYMVAVNLPPAFNRNKFGFEKLPDFDSDSWKRVIELNNKKIKRIASGFISGSDIDSKAVMAAKKNCRVVDKNNVIHITRKDIFKLDGIENKTIFCNPPYGIRMGKSLDLENFYKNFGDFLKNKCKGSTAYIYFGDRKFIKHIGLKASWKKPLTSGGLDGRLAKYELY